MKKIFLLFCNIFVLIIIILFSTKDTTMPSPYKTDIEPVTSRFTNIDGITSTYWKSAQIGENNLIKIGPSSVWWSGYILLSNESGDNILNKYEWTTVEIFDENKNPVINIAPHNYENISANVTEFNEFKWLYSKNFEDDNKLVSFIGSIYFDEINNIIYFNLESN